MTPHSGQRILALTLWPVFVGGPAGRRIKLICTKRRHDYVRLAGNPRMKRKHSELNQEIDHRYAIKSNRTRIRVRTDGAPYTRGFRGDQAHDWLNKYGCNLQDLCRWVFLSMQYSIETHV